MIQYVWERCREAEGINRVVVATEDERILAVCEKFGAEAEMTRKDHATGTDRVAEVSGRHGEFDAVLNVQGDEPGISPLTISAVAAALGDKRNDIATAVTPMDNVEEIGNPNIVKAVLGKDGKALYFSRAAIPYHRDGNPATCPIFYRHQGIYGFQRDVLLRLMALPESRLERAESLEQLRWLEAGYRIHCVEVKQASVGIDSPEDLRRFEQSMNS